MGRGTDMIGSVRMDAGSVDRALAASIAADRTNSGPVLADVEPTVRMLSLPQFPTDEQRKWDLAVANRKVTIAHPDAYPAGAGTPVDVLRVIADFDGIQVVANVEGRDFCSVALGIPYLMALGVLMSPPNRQLVERLLRLDRADSRLAVACLGEPHDAVLGNGPLLMAGLDATLVADLLSEGSLELRRRVIANLGEGRTVP